MSQLADKVEKISKVDKKESKPVDIDVATDPDKRVPPNKDHFDSLMVSKVQQDATRIVDSKKTSLMDEVTKLERRVDQAPRSTPAQLVAQAHEVVQKIQEIKDKLNTPNLEIKSSVQNLLRNKLSHIDENLKIALQKAGVEYAPPQKVQAPKNPIERFLTLLTDGQYRLERLGTDVMAMYNNKQEIAPAAMLAVQIKVGFIQQELEFFTNMLNQALQSTKTVMNVQV